MSDIFKDMQANVGCDIFFKAGMVLLGGNVTGIFFPCRSMGAVMLNKRPLHSHKQP